MSQAFSGAKNIRLTIFCYARPYKSFVFCAHFSIFHVREVVTILMRVVEISEYLTKFQT